MTTTKFADEAPEQDELPTMEEQTWLEEEGFSAEDQTLPAQPQMDGMNAFISVFADMQPQERVAVISAVGSWFCLRCGVEYPNCGCQTNRPPAPVG